MAKKLKIRDIDIVEEHGAFNAFFKKFTGDAKAYNNEGLSTLRKLLSNEKARLLHVIKTKKPHSIYQLSKLLGRDFKAVSSDIELLERFGFIEMISEKVGKRARLKPELISDTIQINIRI